MLRRWIPMRLALVLALVLATATARADTKLAVDQDRRRIDLPNHDAIVIDGGVWAVRGKLRVALSLPFEGKGISRFERATLAGDAIDLVYGDFCDAATFKLKLPLSTIEARFGNLAALALHGKKQYAAAAKGFAKARALDPAWDLPVLNLASAQNLDGHPRDAIATLAPMLAADPVTTYLHVLHDPELQALLAEPELAALRTPKPGAAKGKEPIAYAANLHWFATTLSEACGMSDRAFDYLALISADGAHHAAILLNDCRDPSIKGARAEAERLLADLGFEPVPDADVQPGSDRTKVRLAKEKLGVVSEGRHGTHVRLVRDNTVLVEQPSLAEFLVGAVYVPAARAVVYVWNREQPEAECGLPPPYSGLGVLRVP